MQAYTNIGLLATVQLNLGQLTDVLAWLSSEWSSSDWPSGLVVSGSVAEWLWRWTRNSTVVSSIQGRCAVG